MNAAQLKEAGFSDDEIRSWLSSKHAELKAAGFNDAEIEAKYGPTPARRRSRRPSISKSTSGIRTRRRRNSPAWTPATS